MIANSCYYVVVIVVGGFVWGVCVCVFLSLKLALRTLYVILCCLQSWFVF